MNYETGLEQSVRWIMDLDRMIHEPSRLAILTILRHDTADYLSIQQLTGLSKGNLSNHLAKLEEAGLVNVGKHFEGKTPVTTLGLTGPGRTKIEAYWTRMRSIAAEDYDPASTTQDSAHSAARVDSRETSPYSRIEMSIHKHNIHRHNSDAGCRSALVPGDNDRLLHLQCGPQLQPGRSSRSGACSRAGRNGPDRYTEAHG